MSFHGGSCSDFQSQILQNSQFGSSKKHTYKMFILEIKFFSNHQSLNLFWNTANFRTIFTWIVQKFIFLAFILIICLNIWYLKDKSINVWLDLGGLTNIIKIMYRQKMKERILGQSRELEQIWVNTGKISF